MDIIFSIFVAALIFSLLSLLALFLVKEKESKKVYPKYASQEEVEKLKRILSQLAISLNREINYYEFLDHSIYIHDFKKVPVSESDFNLLLRHLKLDIVDKPKCRVIEKINDKK